MMDKRATIGVLAAVALTMALLPAAPASATLAGSGINGEIAYGGQGTVYAYDPSTGARVQVSQFASPSARDGQVSYSPDGSSITFTHNVGNFRQIYIADHDGSNAVRLTGFTDEDATVDHSSPNFSPDGRTILFQSGGAQDISTMALDGSNRVETGVSGGGSVVWNPNGTEVLFNRGTLAATYSLVDGTITTLPGDGALAMMPNYSPDGTQIAYVRRGIQSCNPSCQDRVWVMDADGTNAHEVDSTGNLDLLPQWSPDGRHILFDSRTPDGLFLIDPDGSGKTRLPLVEPDGIGNHEIGVAAWRPRPAGEPALQPQDGSLSVALTDGGTVTTGVTASPEVPVQTAITAPSGVSGTLQVQPQPTGITAPAGYTVFDGSVVLDGPALDPATQSPYSVTFTVDASQLGGVAVGDVQLFRNGEALPDCSAAVPIGDPCVVSRTAGSDGDAVITARTWHFSTWTPGARVVLNQPPTADNVSVTTVKNTKTSIALLASDPEGATLTYAVTAPQHGQLTGTAPSLTYTPTNGYSGPDSFTYTVSDAKNTSPTATVSIIVGTANRPPIAHSALVLTRAGTAVAITLRGTDADRDALTFAHTNPSHGVLTGSGSALTLTPAKGFTGLDAFTFTVSDGKTTSAKATILIYVAPKR